MHPNGLVSVLAASIGGIAALVFSIFSIIQANERQRYGRTPDDQKNRQRWVNGYLLSGAPFAALIITTAIILSAMSIAPVGTILLGGLLVVFAMFLATGGISLIADGWYLLKHKSNVHKEESFMESKQYGVYPLLYGLQICCFVGSSAALAIQEVL
tara:strand:- start:9117 stop:9584 length:468 start_codon:yes stop_codon:yes gene_type:complete